MPRRYSGNRVPALTTLIIIIIAVRAFLKYYKIVIELTSNFKIWERPTRDGLEDRDVLLPISTAAAKSTRALKITAHLLCYTNGRSRTHSAYSYMN